MIVEIVRYVNLILGVLVLGWLLVRRYLKPEWFPRGGLRRDIWAMAVLWTMALIVGTFEQLYRTDTYLRVGFSLAALLTTISILLRPFVDWSIAPKDKNASR